MRRAAIRLRGWASRARAAARVLGLCAGLVSGTALAQDRAFDPGRMTRDDVRLMQAALAFDGRYVGRLDGQWGPMTDRALSAADGLRVDEAEAIDTLLAFFDDAASAGWEVFAPGGTSALVPGAILSVASGEDWIELADPTRDLVIRYVIRSPADTAEMHLWLEDAHVGPAPLYRADTTSAYVSKGRLDSGRTVYLRTIFHEGIPQTVLVQWTAGGAPRARVVVASLATGPQPALRVAPDGYLATILDRDAAAPPPVAEATSGPPARPGPAPDPAPGADRHRSHGTAFFIGPGQLLTAAHVVEGCGRLALEDGTAVAVLATDAALDAALLATTSTATSWLAAGDAHPLRLGQEIFVLGFPYSRREADGLVATSGLLSGLATGADNGPGRPRHMISAPVQPGNSGGPVLSRAGRVVALVTSRRDDLSTLAATGTVPQNDNFATPIGPILGFLKRHGLRPAPPPGDVQALGDGIPARIGTAVRRVLCWP